MKTLFLKSNLLHIRLKEGEFEVSNPETAGIMQNGKFFLWHTDSNGGYKHTESEGVDCEWPYGVERVSDCSCQVNLSRCFGPCGADTTVKIRLLPEEKKDLFDQALDKVNPEIKQQVDKEIDRINSTHSFTESAYKEVESSEPQEKRTIEDVKNSVARNAGLKDWDEVYKRILPSQVDPLVNQAIRWSIELYKSKPASAPSESQEEMCQGHPEYEKTIEKDLSLYGIAYEQKLSNGKNKRLDPLSILITTRNP